MSTQKNDLLEELELEQSLKNFETEEELELYASQLTYQIAKLKAEVEELKKTTTKYVSCVETDRKIVLESVKNYGWALEYASEELKNDYEVVMQAIENDSTSLACASDELKNDYEVVSKAVKLDAYALEYASESLKKDKEIIALYIDYFRSIIDSYSDLKQFMVDYNSPVDYELLKEILEAKSSSSK